MNRSELNYQPVEGKTYSLFGSTGSTCGYFENIGSLADRLLEGNDIVTLLGVLRKNSGRKGLLKKIVKVSKNNSLISICLNSVNTTLKQYTVNTEGHLRDLPVLKLWDRRLATTEEQYHLYMLEIELTNRLNRDAFLSSDQKISLQPYCLQDFSADCRAANTGFDFQCRSCSKKCFQDHASRILKDKGIEPYIWMGASLSKAAREAKSRNKTIGILGIACIPELVMGMRKCIKHKIPVVGIPLNANRCIRWFGEFHQNSVDLDELKKLIK